jgi:hypothetical protein
MTIGGSRFGKARKERAFGAVLVPSPLKRSRRMQNLRGPAPATSAGSADVNAYCWLPSLRTSSRARFDRITGRDVREVRPPRAAALGAGTRTRRIRHPPP